MSKRRRIIIKIGTNLLTHEDNHLNDQFIANVASQMAALKAQGNEVVLVSSGATTAGRSRLQTTKETKNIPFKQALAAVGQGLLTHRYKKAFIEHKVTIAQVLLTNHDFTHRTKYLNILHTLELLLRFDVLPIINENDVTSIKEYSIGENDMLSAQLSAMLGADLLLILTTVDGLYTGIPGKDPTATFIPKVENITDEISDFAKGALSKNSSGGMATKIKAAQFATQSGVPVVIAHGRKDKIIERIVLDGEYDGTLFPTKVSKLECRKNWLRHLVKENALIKVDDGAVNAITNSKRSLLPAGVIEVQGEFHRGDIIHVCDSAGKPVALGQVNYGFKSLNKIKGHQSQEIPEILGKTYEDEVINRDQLVLL